MVPMLCQCTLAVSIVTQRGGRESEMVPILCQCTLAVSIVTERGEGE